MTPRRKYAIAAGVLIIIALAIIGVLAAPPSHADPIPPAPLALHTDPDQKGARYSEYTGEYFHGGVDEGFRRCVLQRESRSNYTSTNREGGYFGGYQMSRALAIGAAWEMRPELKRMYPTRWRLIFHTLLDSRMDLWARPYQDQAFYTILNVDGAREGAPHWSGGRWHCAPGMSWAGA